MAEEDRKKRVEIDLKGLEFEHEMSNVSENAEESSLTRISPQLTIDKKDRTHHRVEPVDHNQPDDVVVFNQEQHYHSTAPEKTYPINKLHGQVLQELIISRQLLEISYCISVTTFTDNLSNLVQSQI